MQKDPLSCLISLADILEEFGRPAASFLPSSDATTVFYDYPCLQTVLEVRDNRLAIQYVYGAQGDKLEYGPKCKTEVDSYFNDKNGYIDLSSIGIEGVDCTSEIVTDEQAKRDIFKKHLLRVLLSILPKRGEGTKATVKKEDLSRFKDLDLMAQMDDNLQKDVQGYPYLFRYIQEESTPGSLVFEDIVPQG